MAVNIKTFGDCLDLAKRRKYVILIPWVLFSLIALVVAFNMPKKYRSTATMLYQAPLPKLFESTATQFADEQIQSIYQKIMTTDNVLSIIQSFQLYEDIKEGYTEHELALLFKESAEVNLVASSLESKASSGMAEIAFDLSFSDSDAVTAKEIASNLATLFIEQNDKARSQRASNATDFLVLESEKLNQELHIIDNKIADYKEKNNFSLPEQTQSNLAALDRTENDLRDTESQILTTKERIAFLSAELARAPEELSSKIDEKEPQSKEDTLRSLRAQYLKLSSVYSPSHPTLTRLKSEIRALDPSFDAKQISGEEIYNELAEAKADLKLLLETYSSNHPDIAQRKIQIAKLEQKIKQNSIHFNGEREPTFVHSRNPAYVGIEAQYKTSQSELQSLIQKKEFLSQKLDKMQNLVTLAPQVEKGYNDLVREQENTMKKYTQLKEKLLDAKLFQSQELQQQGQTLTIMEKPIVPRYSEKAIRRKVAIGGFFAGMLFGIALALVLDFFDPKLKGTQAIANATGLMPLIVIPYINSPEELDYQQLQEQKGKNILLWSTLVLTFIAIAIAFIFFSPFGHN